MKNKLKNSLLAILTATAFVIPQSANAQRLVDGKLIADDGPFTIGNNARDTIYAVSPDKNDTAKVLYHCLSTTNISSAFEIDGILYYGINPTEQSIYKNPKTRAVPGKDYGYEFKINDINSLFAELEFVGRTDTPEPTPTGKELQMVFEYDAELGKDTLWDGRNIRIAKARGPPIIMELSVNGEMKRIGDEFGTGTYSNGDEYEATFGLGNGEKMCARILRLNDEDTVPVASRRPSYKIENQKLINSTDAKMYNLLGRNMGYINHNEIARKVMQNSAGTYIIKKPNGSSIETRLK